MGKGDKKTKKGKITLGTFGVRRPKKTTKTYVPKKSKKAAPVEKPVTAKAEKKAPAKPKDTKSTKKTE